MSDTRDMKQLGLCVLGAAIGGFLGYHGVFWVAQQGLYAMVLPGGLLGIGAGVGKCRFAWVAPLFAICAVVFGLFTEWKFEPFIADNSLGYFLAHLGQLRAMTWIMIGLGAVIAFFVSFRRSQDAK